MTERKHDMVVLEVGDPSHVQKEEYQLLQELEFTSDRKRMSVIVRNEQES